MAAAVPPAVIAGFPAGAGAGAAPVPVALPPSTYQSRFGDAQFDLLGGQYQGLYAEQSVVPIGGAAAAPDTRQLLNGAIRAATSPACVAYAMLIREANGNLRVKTFVNLARYPSLPGFPATPWDNRLFAQQSDIVCAAGGFTHFSVAEWPNDSFNLSGSVRTMATGEMTTAITALADPEGIIGAVDPAVANSEEIRTRRALPLGAQLASLTIGRDLSPQEFWNQVCVHILNIPTLTAACQHVVNWGRVALTEVQAANGLVANEVTPLDLVGMDGTLLNHRMQFVQRDLPGLVAGSGDPMNQVAQAMGAFTTEAREARRVAQENRVSDKQPKGPADKWKTLLPTLLKLCEVGDQTALPPLYKEIAKGTKREELPAFQGDLNRVATADTSYNREPPVVSAKMLRRLVDLEWAAHDDSDLEGGLTPWHTIYVSKGQQADLQRQAAKYNLLVGGDTVSYADVDKFDAIDTHVSLPVKFSQVKRSLEAYVLVCISGLGLAHRWTREARRSVQAAQRYEFELEEKFDRRPELCANVIRWFSLRHNQFFKSQRLSLNAIDAIVMPLTSIWDEILLDCWMPPPLPSTYQQVVTGGDDAASAISNLTGVTGAFTNTPPTYSGATSTPPAESKTGSGLSPTNRSTGTAAINQSIDPKVKELAGVGWKSRQVQWKFSTDWPKNKDGGDMCLPWHTSGCYTNCGKKKDHRPQTEEEKSTLCGFLEKNFEEWRKN
jgi:hypothetical protein